MLFSKAIMGNNSSIKSVHKTADYLLDVHRYAHSGRLQASGDVQMIFSNYRTFGKIIDFSLDLRPKDIKTKSTHPFFQKIVMSNNLGAFRFLISVCDVNHIHKKLSTPLNCAIDIHNIYMIKELLTHPDIDPNLEGPLLRAINNQAHDIVQMLLDHPHIDPNIIHKHQTPLISAINNNDEQTVTMLLSHPRIDVNLIALSRPTHEIIKSITPLICAIKKGNIPIVQKLLEHPQIDPNHCVAFYHTIIGNSVEIAKMLIDHSQFDVNLTFLSWNFTDGENFLQTAIKHRSFEITKLLVNHPQIYTVSLNSMKTVYGV